MATATRTDIHRPSAVEFDPDAYAFYGVFDFAPEWNAAGKIAARQAQVNALVERGYRFGGGTKGCGHCGANFRYGALVARPDVKEMMFIGETCLNGRFQMSQEAFRAFRETRKGAAADRERLRKVEAIAALKAEHPLLAGLDDRAITDRNSFLAELAWKLERYGSLFPKQIAAAEGIIRRLAPGVTKADTVTQAHPLLVHLGTELVAGINFLDDLNEKLKQWGSLTERQIAAAERIISEKLARREKAAEVATAGIAIPEGRVTVTGRVTEVKEEPCDYRGYFDVMTVTTDAGYTVEVTVPAKLLEAVENDAEALVGQRVRFDAQIVARRNEPGAAWGKRPTKPALLG